MKHVYIQYWADCISEAAAQCGATLTEEQIEQIAEAVAISHDNYGLAFYQPPSSDTTDRLEREYQAKLKKLEKEFERYQRNAERQMGRALNLHDDDHVRISEDGVYAYGGRIRQIL